MQTYGIEFSDDKYWTGNIGHSNMLDALKEAKNRFVTSAMVAH